MAEKKKVAIFLNQCLPLSEIFVRHQVEALEHYTPKLVACRSVVPSVAGNLPQAALNQQSTKSEKIKELLFKLTLKSPYLKEAVKDCDLIHAHFGPTGWLASGLAKETGTPLVVTFHGFDVLKKNISMRKDGLLQKVYHINRQKLAQRASKFICVSEYIKQRAVEFGFPEEKCVVHYMGIPLIEHSVAKHTRRNEKEPVRLLAVGRLVPFKGHTKLIEAVAGVEALGYNVELNIVGGGPLKEELEKQAKEKLKKYKFWGPQPHEKVLSLMRQSDIFCHSSMHMDNGQTEAFGLVVLEAQWAGLPVVAFNSGGVPEAIDDGKTGVLVPEGNASGFAEALSDLIKDQDKLKKMSDAAPAFVKENFDNKKQAAKLEDIYNSVLKN